MVLQLLCQSVINELYICLLSRYVSSINCVFYSFIEFHPKLGKKRWFLQKAKFACNKIFLCYNQPASQHVHTASKLEAAGLLR